MPEPSKIKTKMIQKWWDDAMEGNITNPWLREDIGDDLDLKEEFIFEKMLPLFEPSQGLRGKMRMDWAAERDQAQGAQPTPPPAPTPMMDDILREQIGLAGSSGAGYQNQ